MVNKNVFEDKMILFAAEGRPLFCNIAEIYPTKHNGGDIVLMSNKLLPNAQRLPRFLKCTYTVGNCVFVLNRGELVLNSLYKGRIVRKYSLNDEGELMEISDILYFWELNTSKGIYDESDFISRTMSASGRILLHSLQIEEIINNLRSGKLPFIFNLELGDYIVQGLHDELSEIISSLGDKLLGRNNFEILNELLEMYGYKKDEEVQENLLIRFLNLNSSINITRSISRSYPDRFKNWALKRCCVDVNYFFNRIGFGLVTFTDRKINPSIKCRNICERSTILINDYEKFRERKIELSNFGKMRLHKISGLDFGYKDFCHLTKELMSVGVFGEKMYRLEVMSKDLRSIGSSKSRSDHGHGPRSRGEVSLSRGEHKSNTSKKMKNSDNNNIKKHEAKLLRSDIMGYKLKNKMSIYMSYRDILKQRSEGGVSGRNYVSTMVWKKMESSLNSVKSSIEIGKNKGSGKSDTSSSPGFNNPEIIQKRRRNTITLRTRTKSRNNFYKSCEKKAMLGADKVMSNNALSNPLWFFSKNGKRMSVLNKCEKIIKEEDSTKNILNNNYYNVLSNVEFEGDDNVVTFLKKCQNTKLETEKMKKIEAEKIKKLKLEEERNKAELAMRKAEKKLKEKENEEREKEEKRKKKEREERESERELSLLQAKNLVDLELFIENLPKISGDINLKSENGYDEFIEGLKMSKNKTFDSRVFKKCLTKFYSKRKPPFNLSTGSLYYFMKDMSLTKYNDVLNEILTGENEFDNTSLFDEFE